MSDNPGEQRSRPRIGIDVACTVTRDHAQWYGRCVDATMDGLRLQLKAPFAVGDKIQVKLEGEQREFFVTGTVVRVVGEDIGVNLDKDVESSRALFQLLLEQTRAQNDECERLVEDAISRGRGPAPEPRPTKPARLVSLGDPFDSDTEIQGI